MPEAPAPLDVAIVMFDFGPTGVVRNALRIARASAAAGLAVELWVVQDAGTMRSEVPEGVPVVAFGPTLGTDYTRADRRRAGKSTLPALAALIGQRSPKVVLSAGNHFHSQVAAASRVAGHPARLILRVSTGLPRPDGASPLAWARYWWKRGKAVRRQREADLLVAVSREVGEELAADMGYPADRIVVIPNGIDRAAIDAKAAAGFDHPWFAPGAPPVILGVGRIDKFKNFELLIDAFAALRATRPLQLMIVGEERGAWKHRLDAQIARLELAEDIRFEGFQPNPHAYFRRAAAYVCCSRYEGMSNAMLEAMANGCPVVATRTATGARELLEGGVGPLAEPNATALAAAIAARIDAPRDIDTLQSRAADYDLARTIEAYVDLLTREARS